MTDHQCAPGRASNRRRDRGRQTESSRNAWRLATTAIPGSEFEIPVDGLIIAVGTSANPIVQASTPGLDTDRRGYITVDPETLRTSRQGVFAGGDIVTGAATVILAMGAGRKAAGAIDAYLQSGEWEPAAARDTTAVL